jgi:hypothetical protein
MRNRAFKDNVDHLHHGVVACIADTTGAKAAMIKKEESFGRLALSWEEPPK